MAKPVLNLDSLHYVPWGKGDAFEAKLGQIGTRLGAQKLGYSLIVVPPGKRAFPFHSHRTNEEMFLILEGSGELRIGDEVHAVRKGDVIACAPGGPETAHQIANTGTVELKYLGVSTMVYPEIAEYPDSGKYAAFHALPPDAQGNPQRLRLITKRQSNMDDYWEGEV
jgi:uncharacterized cupin superfamily protein